MKLIEYYGENIKNFNANSRGTRFVEQIFENKQTHAIINWFGI